MSLDSFIGLDGAEPMSESAFEAFKERMKAAAAQIAAIKKEESKQKKKEDELIKILLKFIHSSHKTELVLLISRALEQNIPAVFILAVVLLGNEDIQREIGHVLMLQSGEVQPDGQTAQSNSENANPHALAFFKAEDESMPLKVKIEIDNWIKNMIVQAEENPQKLLKTAYDIQILELEDERKEIKPVLINLAAYVLRDFLESHGQQEPYEKLQEFSQFILMGILTKARENLDNIQLIEDTRHSTQQ